MSVIIEVDWSSPNVCVDVIKRKETPNAANLKLEQNLQRSAIRGRCISNYLSILDISTRVYAVIIRSGLCMVTLVVVRR